MHTDLLPIDKITGGVNRDAGERAERARYAEELIVNSDARRVWREAADDRIVAVPPRHRHNGVAQSDEQQNELRKRFEPKGHSYG